MEEALAFQVRSVQHDALSSSDQKCWSKQRTLYANPPAAMGTAQELCTNSRCKAPSFSRRESSLVQVAGHKVSATGIPPRRFDDAAFVHHHGAAGVKAATLGGVERRWDIPHENGAPLVLALFHRWHGR